MFGIIFPFLAAGFDEKTCLLPANYHPPHQTVINIPRHSALPTLPLLELQTKVREYFTIIANCCNYPSFHFTCLFLQTNLFRGI